MLKITHNVNFIHINMSRKDVEKLFGPFGEGDMFVAIDDKTTLEDIVVRFLGKFPSVSQARKNNWGGPIPAGFKEWKISKTKFWSFSPYDEESVSEPPFWNMKSLLANCNCDTVRLYHKQYHKQEIIYGDAITLGDKVARLKVLVPVYVCEHCGDGFTDEEAEAIREKAVEEFKNSGAEKQTDLSST